MTKCAARADAFLTSSSPSVLLRSLILRRPRSFAVLFTFLPEGSERDRERTRTSENQATRPQALRFSRRRGEHETQVTGYEPQGTMGRVQTAGEARLARCLPPAFLCAHIFIERETSGSLRMLIAVVIFGSPSQENRPRGRLLAMFYPANVAQFVPRVFRPRFSE